MIKQNHIFFPILILSALVLIVFGQTISFDFVNYDDPLYVGVLKNKTFSGFSETVYWAFTHMESGDWQPFVWFSWLIDKQIYGLNPMGFHLTNVLLHFLVVVVFFIFLKTSTNSFWKSFLVAAFFAIHPLRVESVAWVAERKDLLSAFWMMLTLLAYSQYVKSQRRWGWYILSLTLYACALMTKPMVVTLPILMLLFDYWPYNRFSVKKAFGLLLEKIPFLLMALGTIYFTLTAIQEIKPFLPQIPESFQEKSFNALAAHGSYLFTLFWPADLTFFYWKLEGVSNVLVVVSALVLLIVTVLSLVLIKQKPYLFVGWFWFLIILIPVSGWVRMGVAWKADRYTYFSHIGIWITIIWVLGEVLKERKRIAAIICGICLIVFSSSAWSYCGVWRNSETLYAHAIKVSPDNYRAYINLGIIRLREKKYDEAIKLFTQAIEANPYVAKAYRNLGRSYFELEKWDEAFKYFQVATKMMPDDVVTHFALGQIYANRGQTGRAIAHLEVGLKFEKAPPVGVCRTLGRLWRKQGNLENSIKFYKKALAIDSENAAIHNNLANVYYMNKDISNARKHFKRTIEIEPGHDNANKLLAIMNRQKESVSE